MRTSVVIFVLLLSLIGSAAPADDNLIEVTISCPIRASLVDAYSNPINFKNHLQAHYSDTSGQSGKLDFEGEGGGLSSGVPLESVRRDGQKIECRYRSNCGEAGIVTARYTYKVKREIVTCQPSSGHTIRCKVKP